MSSTQRCQEKACGASFSADGHEFCASHAPCTKSGFVFSLTSCTVCLPLAQNLRAMAVVDKKSAAFRAIRCHWMAIRKLANHCRQQASWEDAELRDFLGFHDSRGSTKAASGVSSPGPSVGSSSPHRDPFSLDDILLNAAFHHVAALPSATPRHERDDGVHVEVGLSSSASLPPTSQRVLSPNREMLTAIGSLTSAQREILAELGSMQAEFWDSHSHPSSLPGPSSAPAVASTSLGHGLHVYDSVPGPSSAPPVATTSSRRGLRVYDSDESEEGAPAQRRAPGLADADMPLNLGHDDALLDSQSCPLRLNNAGTPLILDHDDA